MENIVAYVLSEAGENDLVGFTFFSPEFKHRRPGWLRFKPAGEIKMEDLWGLLAAVFQSNSQGLDTGTLLFFIIMVIYHVSHILGTFSLTTTIVERLVGRGRVRFNHYTTFEEECKSRRGIIVIDNRDHLCLPRALVVARTYADNATTADKQRMRKNVGNVQDKATHDLMTASGVNIPAVGGGVEELQAFQRFYGTDYKIVVHRYGSKGRDVIFKGEQGLKTLNLLYHKGHYNVITSVTAAFCCTYYCEFCNIPYEHKNEHRCAAQCPACQKAPPCIGTLDRVLCKDCNREFRGPNCYEEHKRANVCSRVKRCETCLATMNMERKGQHKCGQAYCQRCKELAPIGEHLCYIKPDSREPPTKDYLFIYFDLETRQEGDYDTKTHTVNLCVSQQCCAECLNLDVVECTKCGIRQRIFDREPIIIEEFMRYVLEARKVFIIFIS